VGGAGFTLTVNGSNFVASSVVRWNGGPRPTTVAGSGQLTAAITAADIATQGSAPVTVFTPAPGGGTSASLSFTISPAPQPGGGSFADTFDRGDTPALANGWTPVAGTLMTRAITTGAVPGQARNATTKQMHTSVRAGLVGPTQNVSAKFASVDNNFGPRFGLLVRHKDSKNYYICYRQTGGSSILRIARVVNGVETVLKSGSIANPQKEQFFTLGCQAGPSTTPTTLTLTLGTTKLTVTDATFPSGSVGMTMGYPSGTGTGASHRADDFNAVVQ
jgi:hypothetical protein